LNDVSKTTPYWKKTATASDAQEHGVRENEFVAIKKALGRDINIVELGICSALFSEHCSYKSTKTHLRTLPTTGPRVLVGPGENACVVDIGDGDALVFKVESHNHPSFIEPFQGAATGVGGILRDIFTMGARPLVLMNALRFGDPALPKSRYLLRRSVNGIGFYGNCMGIPTIGGELCFDLSFNGNCLVNAFALGVVKKDEVFLGRATGIGNKVLYVGSKTGRDGIHGASMSSEEFNDDSEAKRPTVQVGDPFQEKLLLEACLEAFRTNWVVGIQDMGAAGLTSSSFEMADRGQAGVRLHLDRVPQRETEMNPYEIMLSESQERMLIVAEQGKEAELVRIFEHWELDAVVIGEVVTGDAVELYWHGELVSSMPAHLLTSAVPEYRWPETAPSDPAKKLALDSCTLAEPSDLGSVWLNMLGSPNLCSRQLVYRQYDSTVRSNTVIHPGADGGVIRLKAQENVSNALPEKGIAVTLDCNSRYCAIEPRRGTALSVAEACRNLACVGAQPIGISDCLNMPSPEKPENMWQIAECIRGLGEAARTFDVPVVSGNVSLYNETNGKGIQPTPLLAVVGLMSDASRAIGGTFKEKGDVILLLGTTHEDELGGSEYLALHFNRTSDAIPALDYKLEKQSCEAIRTLIDRRLLRSCHDLSQGGLAIALAECCFQDYASPLGATLDLQFSYNRRDAVLFSESGARFIISCKPGDEEAVRRLLDSYHVPVTGRGTVGGNSIAIQGIASISASDAYTRWWNGLDSVFGEL